MRVNTLPLWQIKQPLVVYLPWVEIFVYCQIKSNAKRLLTRGQLVVDNHKQKDLFYMAIMAYFRVIVNTYIKKSVAPKMFYKGYKIFLGGLDIFADLVLECSLR